MITILQQAVLNLKNYVLALHLNVRLSHVFCLFLYFSLSLTERVGEMSCVVGVLSTGTYFQYNGLSCVFF